MARIDRSSPMPFYHQLRELLEEEIRGGRWAPGDRLPTESELCEQFGVSRSTVRQALAALESDAVAERQKGLGTFVAQARPQTWLVQSSDGVFRQDLDRMGHHVSTRVLRAVLEPLPRWAADALGAAPDADGVTLERLRHVDGRAALYVVSHLPAFTAATVLAADLGGESLYDLLQREHGLEIHGARRTLEAVVAADRLARLLETAAGSPLAFVESVSWDGSQRPFDCYRAWLRTDRLPIEIGVSSLP